MAVTRSVYDPARHTPTMRLRFAVAAVVNSARDFVADPSPENFAQLEADVEERNIAWDLDDIVRLRPSETV